MAFEISFNGSLIGAGVDCGYGYAATELIHAWQRYGHPVWWAKAEAPIAISFCQPEWYDWQTDAQIKIGYTPWESTLIPWNWKGKMNQMDEIWTTSHACKLWFEKNGIVKPIRVLAHGINKEHWPVKKRKLGEGQPFTFLHVGSETERKGGKIVYDAFRESFTKDENVRLILKGNVSWEPNDDRVEVIRKRLTQEALTKLYLDSHAMIYPTMGEGFGLIPFQAAATGMPTAVTDWGGCRDFMHWCYPIRVEKEVEAHYDPHIGRWALPSMDSVIYWMQSFYDSPNYFFGKSLMKARTFEANWSWDIVAKLSLNWMRQLLEIR